MTTLSEPVNVGSEQTGKAFVLALALYFAAQVVIRVAQLDGLEWDEAESVFFAQEITLGYGSQPPLYVWLQWLFFEVFGTGHVGLSLLKNALLFMLYGSVFGLARQLLGSLAASAIAASLVLIVPLGWEAQMDRSHSILATALAAAALWTYFALLRQPGTARRMLLGLLLGLGMQSKYNFVIFLLGLAMASLAVPAHRKVIWTRDIWITIAVATLCLLPHGFWFVQQFQTATQDTLNKMNDGNVYSSYTVSVQTGVKNLIYSIVSYITPLWIALVAAYRSPRQARPHLHTPDARLFLWLYVGGLACITVLIFSGQLAHTKSRWLQTLLFSLPLACFVWFPPQQATVYRRLLVYAAVCGGMITIVLGLRPYVQSAFGRHPRINQPYPELSNEIARRFPGVGTIVVPDRIVGGNLHIQPPHFRVRLPGELCRDTPAGTGKVLVLLQPGSKFHPNGCLKEVIEAGQMAVRSREVPVESLLFDYALVLHGARPR
ncbi:glycosyltransferase family 39 protein [Massilia horti]|uniref:glycosyltransferase family 39 protein n=1 Tax=Massilia horti TaxID=2562153 RepID=UPI001431F7C1|nr:glycosyltransferase family 39 protein [Massilia horti]